MLYHSSLLSAASIRMYRFSWVRFGALRINARHENFPRYTVSYATPNIAAYPLSLQDKTVYSYETVTDLYSCMESNNVNMSTLNDTKSCSAIRNYITLFNISCSNFTQTVRQVSVEKHDGMNILGIIVFTIAFAIVLSRQPGGRRVVEVIGVLNEAIMKLVSLVMW